MNGVPRSSASPTTGKGRSSPMWPKWYERAIPPALIVTVAALPGVVAFQVETAKDFNATVEVSDQVVDAWKRSPGQPAGLCTIHGFRSPAETPAELLAQLPLRDAHRDHGVMEDGGVTVQYDVTTATDATGTLTLRARLPVERRGSYRPPCVTSIEFEPAGR